MPARGFSRHRLFNDLLLNGKSVYDDNPFCVWRPDLDMIMGKQIWHLGQLCDPSVCFFFFFMYLHINDLVLLFQAFPYGIVKDSKSCIDDGCWAPLSSSC